MTLQLDFFDGAGEAHKTEPKLPEDFRYQPELIGPADGKRKAIVADSLKPRGIRRMLKRRLHKPACRSFIACTVGVRVATDLLDQNVPL